MVALMVTSDQGPLIHGQQQSTQREPPRTTGDEAALTADIVELARTLRPTQPWR